MVSDAVANSMGALEDVFVNMALTGKLSFRDMANSIIADLARIMVRKNITGPLGSALEGMTWSNASGTDAFSGGMTRVGERGPEDVYLPQGSRITPAHNSGGNAPNISVAINIENKTGQQVKAKDGGTSFNIKGLVKNVTLELMATDPDFRGAMAR